MFLDAVFARIPSVRARLVLLTVLLCGLMASLALSGMVLLSQSNESLRTVYDDRVVPLQQLKTVADLYAVNIVDTSHKVRNGNLSWSAGLQLVAQAGAEVQATWKAYTATYLVPEEVRLVEDVLPLMQRADAMRDRLQRVLAAQDEPGLTSLVKEELYQTIDPVSDKLNALVAVQLTVAKQEYLAGLGRYERVRWGAWLGLGLACLIGSLLAGVISTRIMRSLGAEPSAVREVVQGIAKGSLNQTLPVAQGDVSSVMAFMHGMQHALAQLVREVRNNAHELHAASSQIAQGNMDLSSRTEETAVTAQRASAKLDEVTERLQQRILNSGQARVLAQGVLTVGDRVGTQMAALMQAMEGINDSARRIVDIIGVIDSIAFQTNILALNASVESARAGEQGRGFAVVASEVRALATRSAEAAREIKTLIASASERTESGARQVDGTSQTLGAMMDELRTLSELMRRIDLNADTDSQDIEQLHLQVRELDRVAQRNAALVEEMAASSESLKDQAGRLHTAVQVFSV